MSSNEKSSGGFADLFERSEAQSKTHAQPRVGDQVEARVVALGSSSVFLDLGTKAEGVIDHSELLDDKGDLSVGIGDTVKAFVASTKGGTITLRTRMGRGKEASSELKQAFEHAITVMGTVKAVNKGGVEVEVAGQRAFCPVSQLDLHYVEDAQSFVGQSLEFRISRFESEGPRNNIVLSRKVLLQEERKKQAEKMLASLQVGNTLRGKVSTLKDYGAFVELGGVEGMLHVSELSYDRVKHPSEVLQVGQELDVKILKIEKSKDPKRGDRISLSLKALGDNPWDAGVEELKPGQVIKGEVVRCETFGAFVALPSGLEGLVHVSEMDAKRRINHARDAVSIGDEIEVLVLSLDHDRKRISLSMKAVGNSREAAQAKSFKPKNNSLGTFADLFNKK